ncbi:MAG: hypothetical protein GY720_01925 [bacterium]|nr:hypothetical protein [bacterium]
MIAPSTPSRRRRVAAFAFGLVLVLGLLEVLARYTESQGADALRWYDASTQLRVDEMEGLDGIDVVFAGTSMAWQGLVPSVWTAHDPDGRSAFNAGMAGGVPEVMEPWLTDVVLPRLAPELVVWGLSSLDLSTSYGSDNEDRYRDALEARDGALASFERLTARYSALVRYRNVLRDPSEWGEDRGFDEAAAILGADGERRDFEEGITAKRRRQVEARLTEYSIDANDIAAIHRTVVELRAAGTEVVFVHMPVPQRYVALHPEGAADVASTRTAIDRLGEVLEVDVIDASSGFSDRDFVDFTHLDEAAAAAFTERVVQVLSGTAPSEPETTVGDAALLEIANDLIVMSDLVRSALTQKGTLPTSSEFWNTLIEYGHTRDLWAYNEAGTTFHTVFAGSSMVHAGFDPAVFTSETGDTAYNTGLPAAGPEEFGSYLNEVAIPTIDPQRVVMGIAPRDFDSLGPEDCGGPRARYTRALNLRGGAFAQIEWFSDVSTPHMLFGDPVQHEPVRMTPMHAEFRDSFSLLGDRSFYPVETPRQLRKAAENLSEKLSDYRFCQSRLDALTALVADLEGRGIEVIVVALPQSSFIIDPLPGGRAQMEQIMADAGEAVLAAGATQYVDLKDLLADDEFYDLRHTSEAGARKLTEALAAALR